MFCYGIRKRLYDFIQGDLDDRAAGRIKRHLEACRGCAQKEAQLRQILDTAALQEAPRPPADFWKKFDAELDEKLAAARDKGESYTLKPVPSRVSLKPAFALVAVAVVMFAVLLYVYNGLSPQGQIGRLSDEELVVEMVMVEELTGEPILLDDQDALIDEAILLADFGMNGSS